MFCEQFKPAPLIKRINQFCNMFETFTTTELSHCNCPVTARRCTRVLTCGMPHQSEDVLNMNNKVLRKLSDL